jgi:type II secretory pathway component GspD/PulD (secretin)
MRLSRCLVLLLPCAQLLMATQVQAQGDPPAAQVQAQDNPPAAEVAAQASSAPDEPLYSLDVYRQDAESVIWEFAKRAHKTLDLLDRGSSLMSVSFRNLPFDRALKALVRAADLDYVRSEDTYVVGLPVDLKLRFPDPDAKTVEATYRCRRISADSLVKTMTAIFTDAEMKISAGPEFLTPELESMDTALSESASGIKALKAVDRNFHTHDVVFAGPPNLVQRALSLCHKFDRPRKQVRVNIRVVQMKTSAQRQLGVSWMQSLNLGITEVPSMVGDTGTAVTANTAAGSSIPQGNGLSLGKFTHSVVSLSATLNAMEQAGSSKTLANPTLLVLDGEKSFILSGTKYVLPEIDSRDPSGQAVYKTVVVKAGLYLQVGVQVGLDDDMVLSIYPQVTNVVDYTVISAIKYPIINTIEEQAEVRAVKGDVIVLGGIKQEVITDTNNSVPFLSKLPLIGKLFSNDNKSKITEELMFFLTPEIVEDTEQPLDMKMTITPGGSANP